MLQALIFSQLNPLDIPKRGCFIIFASEFQSFGLSVLQNLIPLVYSLGGCRSISLCWFAGMSFNCHGFMFEMDHSFPSFLTPALSKRLHKYSATSKHKTAKPLWFESQFSTYHYFQVSHHWAISFRPSCYIGNVLVLGPSVAKSTTFACYKCFQTRITTTPAAMDHFSTRTPAMVKLIITSHAS